jgi:hypothetical protein
MFPIVRPMAPRRRPLPDNTIFLDRFSDIDGEFLSNHFADIGGLGWVMSNAEWTIQSNQLALDVDNSADGQCLAYRVTSAADVYITTDILVHADTDCGIVFNYVDDLNYWMWVYTAQFETWTLYQVVDGGFNVEGQWANTETNGMHTAEVNVNGDNVECRVDGVTRLSMFFGGRNFKTSQNHGVRVYGPGAGAFTDRFDNYRIRPATVFGP